MYFRDIAPCKPDEDFWSDIEYSYEFMRVDFIFADFESENQALDEYLLSGLKTNSDENGLEGIVKYRRTDNHPQLQNFYEGGLALVPVIDAHIAKREMTEVFFIDWGQFCFCHGFLMNSAFAHGNDLQGERARIRGGEAVSVDDKRIWFSKMFIRELENPKYDNRNYGRKKNRINIEDDLTLLIADILKDNSRHSRKYPELSLEWFAGFLNKEGMLKSTFTTKYLGTKYIKQDFSKRSIDNLPPLDLKIPIP